MGWKCDNFFLAVVFINEPLNLKDALDDGEDYSIQITDKRAKLDEDFNEKKFDPDYTVTGDGFGPKKGKTEKSKQVKTRKRVQKKVTTKAYEWEEEKIKPMVKILHIA